MKEPSERFIRWDVYVPRTDNQLRWIDAVFFTVDCDKQYVKQSLINHDNYPSTIVICRQTIHSTV